MSRWCPINNFTDVSFIFVVYGENTFWAAGEFFAAGSSVSFFGIKTPHSPVISCSCATWVLSIDCVGLGPILLSMSHQSKNRTHFSQAMSYHTKMLQQMVVYRGSSHFHFFPQYYEYLAVPDMQTWKYDNDLPSFLRRLSNIKCFLLQNFFVLEFYYSTWIKIMCLSIAI